MVFKADHPLTLPAAYYKPIGEIIFRWSLLELYVENLVWHCMNLPGPKEGRSLTSQMSASNKLDLFNALTIRWVTDPAIKAEMASLHSAARKLSDYRNDIAHGLWATKPAEPKVLRLMRIPRTPTGPKILPRSRTVGSAEISGKAKELKVIVSRLRKLTKRVGAPMP
jgi:hypothetical protein